MDNNSKWYVINQSKQKYKQTDVYNITWTINKFNELFATTDTISRAFGARKYTMIEVLNSEFLLKINFLGQENGLLEIYYLSPTSVFLKEQITVSVCENSKNFSNDYHSVRAHKWQYCAPLNDPIDVYTKFLTTSNSYSYNTRTPMTANIILTFKFTVTKNVSVNCIPAAPSQLSGDFGKLLTDSDSHSDVIMESLEGEVFKAHKCVLAVRSNVFKANFVHNMKEAVTNVVETNLETEVLRELLTFVYTDKAPEINDAGKLLAAADYYQLDNLKRICENKLYKNLNVENAIDTLQLAQLYSANNLRQLTMEFIKDGRAKLVIKTQGWIKFQSVELMKMIYELEVAD